VHARIWAVHAVFAVHVYTACQTGQTRARLQQHQCSSTLGYCNCLAQQLNGAQYAVCLVCACINYSAAHMQLPQTGHKCTTCTYVNRVWCLACRFNFTFS
jgi:hypothetical protein